MLIASVQNFCLLPTRTSGGFLLTITHKTRDTRIDMSHSGAPWVPSSFEFLISSTSWSAMQPVFQILQVSSSQSLPRFPHWPGSLGLRTWLKTCHRPKDCWLLKSKEKQQKWFVSHMKSVCLVTCNITRFTGGNNLDISHQCNNVHVSSQFLCQNCGIQTNINLLWPPLFSRLSFRPSVFQPNFGLLWEVSIKRPEKWWIGFLHRRLMYLWKAFSALKGNSQLTWTLALKRVHPNLKSKYI